MKKSRRNGHYRQAVVATLLMGGTFNLVAPVLAVGTGAGIDISNTATATYEDPTSPGKINATSNTVKVTVAEVAGITAVPLGVNDVNQGSVSPGDTLEYNFRITNAGNAASKIFVPGKNKIAALKLDIDKVEVKLPNSSSFTAVTDDDNGLEIAAIDPDASIEVKVTGKVATNAAAGDEVKITLGNTGPNDNSAATQNQPDDGQEGLGGSDPVAGLNEIRTVDANSTPAPANGEREASATDKVSVATQANQPRAFATILETSTHTPKTAAANDDEITYRLDLKVAQNSPNFFFSAGKLNGTTINVDGQNQTRILVSNAIPTGTVFDKNFTPTSLSGWQVVYSTTPINGSSDDPLAAQWTTTQPAASAIKRVGFVYTGVLAQNYSTASDPDGFQFRVITSTMPDTGGNVASIAQVFGQTDEDTSNTIVYDESGDQQPNNFNSDGTSPYPNGAGGFDPNNDSGKADPATQGIDSGKNNTGTGIDGEDVVVSISPSTPPPVTLDIFNGPQNQPTAKGPGDNDDTDFTNKSVIITQTDTGNVDPGEVTFNNTMLNGTANKIDNLVLKPIPASQADYVTDKTDANQVDSNTGYSIDGNLPTNTTVTIDPDGTTGPLGVTYTWDGTAFNVTNGTPIRLSNISSNGKVDYTVKVNLPGNTPQVRSYPVAIAAFVDEDSDNEFDQTSANPTAEPFFNITVDRTYTGYMKLVKKSRILKGTGPDVPADQGDFNSTPGADPDGNGPLTAIDPDPNTPDVFRTPSPGNIIEYQISYTNISTPSSAGGIGNVLLNASNLNIFEDGTGANGNWFTTTTHVLNQAIATSGTVSFYNSAINLTTPGTGVPEAVTNSGYVNFVGSVAPAGTGNFTFQRQVK